MACCGGNKGDSPQNAEEKNNNKQLEQKMYHAHQEEQAINKLLLLGAGESGKSTLFKQMKVLYGTGFGEDRNEHKQIVFSNAVTGIKELLRASEELEKEDPTCAISQANSSLKADLAELKDNASVDEEIAAKILKIWKDPGIQKCYSQAYKFQLPDSAAYFLEKITAIGRPDYVPTDKDILHSRVRTTGIVEDTYTIDGNLFKMFDVGGQRNERKKWIHCFSDVTAMLFVAALSAYDLKLYEDENTNRMQEALTLFNEISHSKWFEKTSIILFLNKSDLFKEKIKTTPLTVAKCLANYTGPQQWEPAAAYIQAQFEAEHPQNKAIYTHITCATDTSTMRVVFNATKDIVIKRSLEEGGLMEFA
eukprot:gb/GEZN01006669.1/.p1 GENE.gb/GEZN01006669.1/~~gb/GEZN01006669.1/.p1  ORF type:complete len:363 (+),score=66.74 gb/GEZN01006669.1/:114-1202(+)